jgi:hypothetical protein
MPKLPEAALVTPCTWEAYVAPISTAIPAADEAIAAPWTSIGLVKEDPTLGLEVSTEKLTASNACSPIKVIVTDREMSWELDQAQFTKLTVEQFFGSGVWAASGDGERFTPAAGLTVVEKALIFEMVDGEQTVRVAHPRVAFTPNGSIEFSTEDIITLPVTATVLAVSGGSEFFIDANPAFAVA